MTALILALLLATLSAASEQTNSTSTLETPITSWLLLGPFPAPLPAFHDSAQKGFHIENLLEFNEMDFLKLQPKAEKSFTWHDGSQALWRTVEASDKEIKIKANSPGPAVAYLAAYIDARRYTRGKIHVTSPQPFQFYLDGRLFKTKSQNNTSAAGAAEVDIQLETGIHRLIIKSVYIETKNSYWGLRASLSYNDRKDHPRPQITLAPEQRMTIAHLLDGPKVTDVSVSPDGSLAAISIQETQPPSDSSESWIELYWLKSNTLYQTFRGGIRISSFKWAPTGKKISYTTRNGNRATLWAADIDTGLVRPILKNISNLGNHTWSPDGSFLIYSVIERGAEDRKGVKRLQNMADRQPGWRDRSYLYKVNLASGTRQRLTAGELSTDLSSISPEGTKLLFTRSVVDYSERPYSKTELYSLDLQSLEANLIWKGRWFNGVQWSPAGDKLLFLGGPSAFGLLGNNVPRGVIPNEYDTQAYIFHLATMKVDPISKNFNPAINRGIWSRTENCIYFLTNDRSFRHLYRYDLSKKTYELIDCGVEALGSFSLAREKPVAVYTGSSAAVPLKSFAIDLRTKEYRLLCDPGQDSFADVNFSKVKRWTFKNQKGVEIEGRIYYPPNFDAGRKYPCIVYYYGGVSPVERSFGGRYPKNLWAAQGYIVYVLQPSGATGFGQRFSAAHVNDWGLTVADEIIEGVKKFLSAHPYVDSSRVACIGASYGGFMTELLLTKTNIFAAAVSHAGISSIASYWGEGYWGYAYSAYAAANSFPWNRKDIYVNQSALFNADKISTPLLLLHGSADTNVPPGESTQLFTALKLLGREVEYIQIFDQNHHILAYNKRILWTKTIIAWFDRWLKREPEWWHNLYPDR
jgi:dipeptidyl aminopeptidase/acylaminoacyl peptidase